MQLFLYKFIVRNLVALYELEPLIQMLQPRVLQITVRHSVYQGYRGFHVDDHCQLT